MTEAKVYQQILVELEEARLKQRAGTSFEELLAKRETLAQKHGVSLEELALVELFGMSQEFHGNGGEHVKNCPMRAALKAVLFYLGIKAEEPFEQELGSRLLLYKGMEYEQFKEVAFKKLYEVFTALYEPIIKLYLAEIQETGGLLEEKERRKKLWEKSGEKGKGFYFHCLKALEGK